MQLWRGSQRARRIARQQGDVGHALGEYYGQQAHGQYFAIWHVQLPGQSHGGSGDSCGFRGADPHAMHTGYRRPLGAWSADGIGGRDAEFAKLFQIDVQLGRGDSGPGPRTNDGHGSLKRGYKFMQYTFSMTPRMITLAAVCFVLLCVLLFLVGMEIGQKMAGQAISVQVPDVSKALPAAPKLPGVAELAAPLAATTKP